MQPPPSASRPLRPNVTSSIKPEVHNIAQCHKRRTEPRQQGICIQNFAKIGPAVPQYARGQTNRLTHTQTDRQTDRRTDRRIDRNTPQPYWGGVNINETTARLQCLFCFGLGSFRSILGRVRSGRVGSRSMDPRPPLVCIHHVRSKAKINEMQGNYFKRLTEIPRLWNDVPFGPRRPGLSFDSFRQSLKTYLLGD